jgi:putative heme iron utilization protein
MPVLKTGPPNPAPNMNIALDQAIHLLHAAASGALATHAAEPAGYPYASALPFMPDELHRPVFLASRLAEHAKNLAGDGRASLLVCADAHSANQPVSQAARLTVVGDVGRIGPAPALRQRYLRYHPDAEAYIDLGDFDFYLLTPRRARHIAGFARMGWLDGAEWPTLPALSLEDEAQLLQALAGLQPAGVRLLGLDCLGMDIERKGRRERQRFPRPLPSAQEIGDSARRLLPAL